MTWGPFGHGSAFAQVGVTAAILLGLLLLANLAYFLKCAAGIDLDRKGHHKRKFPLGGGLFALWIDRRKR